MPALSLHRSLCIASLLIVCTVGIAACGGAEKALLRESADPLGSLPGGIRNASTLANVQGVGFYEASDGAGGSPPFAILDASDADFKYALYAFDPPENSDALSIAYVLANIDTECWLALANYYEGKWEWHQIEAQGGLDTIYFDSPSKYVAPDGNIYWAVVASRGHSVQVTSFTVNHVSTITPAFYAPPSGQQTVDSAGFGPQTVLMPGMLSTGGEVAPVVLYTKTVEGRTELTLGYYDGTAWQNETLFAPRSFGSPQARWLDDEGAVVVFDTSNSQLVDIRVDEWWEQTAERSIPLPSGIGMTVPSLLSMDVDPLSGRLGVAYAIEGDSGRVYWSCEEEDGWSEPYLVAEYEGETVPGLSFKFDPQGGNPWLAFTHGVAEYGSTLTVDYSMEFGRFDGTSWQLTSAGRTYWPMFVELGFDGNTPQVVFSEVREDTIVIQILFFQYPLDVPLFADVVTGTYNGTNWEFDDTPVFTSTLGNSFSLGSMTLTLNLNLAPACGWARSNELFYNHVTGSMDLHVDIGTNPPTVTPQGGDLDNGIPYLIKDGGAYSPSTYFTGDPGMNFSWAQQNGVHACSYIYADNVTVDDIMGGGLFAENTVLFWTPAT